MRGQALVFLDSDDAFHPDMVRTLTETMKREQADLVLGRFTDHVTTGTMDPETTGSLPGVPAGAPGPYNRVQALQALADVRINVSVWNKLYRRALWEGIRFPDGHVFEDLDTTYRVFDRLDRLYLTEQKVYLHRIAPGSITAGWSERKVRDWLLAYSHYEAFLFSHIPDIFSEEQLFSARQIRLNAMLDAYSRLSGDTKEEKAFRRTLRGWILGFADKTGRRRCRFPTRAACCLLRFCPWSLRLAFPLVSILRR